MRAENRKNKPLNNPSSQPDAVEVIAMASRWPCGTQDKQPCSPHKKTACHSAISQVTFPLHLIKRVPGLEPRRGTERITAPAVFLCVPYRHTFFAPKLWWGVQGRLRSGRILCSPVVPTLYVSPPRAWNLWMVSYSHYRTEVKPHGEPQTTARIRCASSHPD